MELARQLGGMTLEEMLDRISSNELVMWKALYELEKEEQDSGKRQSDLINSLR
jgi:hypothetical protein